MCQKLFTVILKVSLSFCLWGVAASAVFPQYISEEPYYAGSWEGPVDKEVRIGDGVFLRIDAMDDGTQVMISGQLTSMAIGKQGGVTLLLALDNKTNSSINVFANLPITIPPNTIVGFTCPRGKFIYMTRLYR